VLFVFVVFNLSTDVLLEVGVFDLSPLISVELDCFKGKFDLLCGEFTILAESVETNDELDILGLEFGWKDLFPDFFIWDIVLTLFSSFFLLLLLLIPDFLLFFLLSELLLDNVGVFDTGIV